MFTLVKRLFDMAAEEHGATAIEYGLIASILALGLIPVLSNTSSGVAGLFQTIADNFEAVGM